MIYSLVEMSNLCGYCGSGRISCQGGICSPLIVIAALLPILGIVLGIDLVSQITIGEIIGISVTIGIVIVAVFWRFTSPSRAYKMTLFDNSIDRLIPNNGKEVSEFRIGKDGIAEIHVRIDAKAGVNIDKIRFRLVNKGCPYGRWIAERGSRAFICQVLDKDLDREREINPYQQSRSVPLYSQEDQAGILHFGNRRLLKGDIMWYRVMILANEEWKGYLEFCGPSGDGRPAYCRHKITLQLNPDKGESEG